MAWLIYYLAATAATSPPIHYQTCRDAWTNCTQAEVLQGCTSGDRTVRRWCAFTCKACTPLLAPAQFGLLHDGRLPIPNDATAVLVEIGSSDRNTLDEEVMPGMPNAFLITAEPLIDKYSRAISRRAPAGTVKDSLEPLGQHHPRGIALPFAVASVASPRQAIGTALALPAETDAGARSSGGDEAVRAALRALAQVSLPGASREIAAARKALKASLLPPSTAPVHAQGGGAVDGLPQMSSGAGELRALNVGGNAGCSSLLSPNRSRHRGGKSFGGWCDAMGEQRLFSRVDSRSTTRHVWTVQDAPNTYTRHAHPVYV